VSPGIRRIIRDWRSIHPSGILYLEDLRAQREKDSFTDHFPSQFLLSLLTLPLAGRYLERVWGAQELLKFVLVVVVVSNVIACIVNTVEGVVLGNTELFLFVFSLSFSPSSSVRRDEEMNEEMEN
jgi:hypothetical protein